MSTYTCSWACFQWKTLSKIVLSKQIVSNIFWNFRVIEVVLLLIHMPLFVLFATDGNYIPVYHFWLIFKNAVEILLSVAFQQWSNIFHWLFWFLSSTRLTLLQTVLFMVNIRPNFIINYFKVYCHHGEWQGIAVVGMIITI